MNLVIVESPAKGKTIEKYLGKDYRVLASFGHVRDLPKSELGVDVEKDFQPKYVIPRKSSKVIKMLKDEIAKADKVLLATDYDREGEAIAYHIEQAILAQPKKEKLKNKDYERITFAEITKDALVNAVKNPRKIDMNLVDAQQARRVLDRLVGYKLSPFLWKKVFKGLSAGRVQSVAVRLIVEKEKEIKKFKPEEYWVLGSKLKYANKEFDAYLKQIDENKIEKLSIKNKSEAEKISNDLEKGKYEVVSYEKTTENKWPFPPFTTSTLQQEASKRLGFSAKQTMMLAQNLYEAGKITYMRTDSVNLSWSAINSTRKFIELGFGKNYLPEKAKVYKTKSKGAQEAHEAIRPTYIKIKPEELEDKRFTENHKRLYELIRNRTLACQMNPAKIEKDTAKIKCDKYLLQTIGSRVVFDGYMKAWKTKLEEKEIPLMKKGDNCDFVKIISEQHFTKPPARYNEASLIKALEENGIGRPSTYAPIISTIQLRGYVSKDKGKFIPNDSAYIVIDLLVENFPEIVDIEFTAQMENKLDDIAENKLSYLKMIKDFYDPFEKNLNEKIESVKKINTEEKTDKKCDKCGKPMVIKMGRFGKFLACSGFPDCKNTQQIVNKIGIKCPDCKEGDIIERKTRRGKTFWGCSSYPTCKWASWNDPRKENSKSEEPSIGKNLKGDE